MYPNNFTQFNKINNLYGFLSYYICYNFIKVDMMINVDLLFEMNHYDI